jgi:hypothetical protein
MAMAPPERRRRLHDNLVGNFDHGTLIDVAGNGHAAAGYGGKRG